LIYLLILDDSIWWYAQQESRSAFNIDLGIEELLTMETAIKKLKQHHNICNDLKVNKRRAQCFHHLVDIIQAGKRDFTWDISTDISKEGKAKIGTLYISYAAMSALLSVIASKNLDSLNDDRKADAWREEFAAEITKLSDFLHDYEHDISTWRTDQISPVEICQVKQLFWKEFTGVCETRWKRSIDDNEKDDEDESKKEFDDNENNDPSLNVADKIGGTTNFYTKLYRGKVFDDVTKETLFVDDAYVKDEENLGTKLISLYKNGMKERWSKEETVRKDMVKYNNNTIKAVRRVIAAAHKVLM